MSPRLSSAALMVIKALVFRLLLGPDLKKFNSLKLKLRFSTGAVQKRALGLPGPGGESNRQRIKVIQPLAPSPLTVCPSGFLWIPPRPRQLRDDQCVNLNVCLWMFVQICDYVCVRVCLYLCQ